MSITEVSYLVDVPWQSPSACHDADPHALSQGTVTGFEPLQVVRLGLRLSGAALRSGGKHLLFRLHRFLVHQRLLLQSSGRLRGRHSEVKRDRVVLSGGQFVQVTRVLLNATLESLPVIHRIVHHLIFNGTFLNSLQKTLGLASKVVL